MGLRILRTPYVISRGIFFLLVYCNWISLFPFVSPLTHRRYWAWDYCPVNFFFRNIDLSLLSGRSSLQYSRKIPLTLSSEPLPTPNNHVLLLSPHFCHCRVSYKCDDIICPLLCLTSFAQKTWVIGVSAVFFFPLLPNSSFVNKPSSVHPFRCW